MTYFNLHSYCYFVKGYKNSALYDTFTSRLFWIKNEYENNIIDLSRQGNSAEQIAEQINKPLKEVTKYIDLLQKLDLGRCHNTAMVSQKFRPIATKGMEFNTAAHSPLLEAVLEVSGKCSLDCNFCGFEKHYISSKCFCGKWSGTNKKISYDVESVIKQLSLYQTIGITLKGGDPFENLEDVETIINNAYKYNIPVNIESPSTSITHTDWEMMYKRHINLTHILFAVNEIEVEHILNSTNKFIVESLERSRIIGPLKLIIKVLLSPETYYYENEIKNYFISKGIQFVFIEKCLLNDASQYTQEQRAQIKNYIFGNTHAKFAVGIDTFLRLNKGHQCWQDRISITMDGLVLPCISFRDKVLGDVKKTLLMDILRENWSNEFEYSVNKNNKPCTNCEFKYGCISCSLMNNKLLGSINSKSWNCCYDPQTGEWNN